MAMTRWEINKKSDEKRGVRQKAFRLDKETYELFEKLTAEKGLSQTEILRQALKKYEEQ